ncbi:GntR family transcriptional regulator, partial [Streptomyces olivaceoviridis]
MPRKAPYLELVDVLRARVLAGEWKTGERLPPRVRLAEEYAVGRNVVQRAMDRLITDGLLEGRAGSGTYVREPRERLRLVRSWHRGRSGGALASWSVRVPRRLQELRLDLAKA